MALLRQNDVQTPHPKLCCKHMLGSRHGTATRSLITLSVLLFAALAAATIATRVVAPLLLPTPSPEPARLDQYIPQKSPDDTDPSTTNSDAAASRLVAEGGPLSSGQADTGNDDRSEIVDAAVESPPGSENVPPRRTPSAAQRDSDVLRLGPGRYRVRRAAIEHAMAVEGVGTTRAVPVTRDDQMIGYRISNVSPSLHQLGLRGGDIITHVNGRALTSPDAALAAYSGLRNANRIYLRLRRGGGNTGVSYIIE
jgi:hypothetical protein